MAGRNVNEVSQAISAVSATGVITVASTVGLYEGAYAYLAKAAQPGVTFRILRVLNATTLSTRLIAEPRGGGAQTVHGDTAVGSYSYGNYDATAYNLGTLTMPAQFVFNPNDLPLS